MGFWKELGQLAETLANAPENAYRAGYEQGRQGQPKDPSMVRLISRRDKQFELSQRMADAYSEGFKDGQNERLIGKL